jgi:DNA primase
MSDLRQLKAQHDLRLIVEADLGPSHGRGGEALLWKCPFHNEQKGYSLAVWRDGWRCFGACSIGGDILDWLQRYRGLTFIDACRVIGGDPKSPTQPLHRNDRQSASVEAKPPTAEWQRRAKKIVEYAQDCLWCTAGEPALRYLRSRGLTSETIQRAGLGLMPGRYWEWRSIGKLNVPCGITIPWFIGDDLWAVKVRRAGGTPKYLQIAGGSANGLYNADNLDGHTTILLVEGEFDALLAEQEAGGLVGVGTLGSAANPLNRRWWLYFVKCQRLLVAYDDDEAGRKGAARLQAITQRARSVRLPYGKDITEFYLNGGNIHQWLTTLL